jgi:acetamidase/formamidase
MKAVFRSLFVTSFIAWAIGAAPSALAADLSDSWSGTWNVAVREFGRNNYYLPMTDGRLEIAADGQSARFRNLTFTATRAADGLHLACSAGGKSCGSLVVRLAGQRLTGSGTLNDRDGLARPVTLEGTRPTPPRPPRHFDFAPTQFHSVYSAAIAPALRLQPGDSVSTRTLDSRGYDRDGQPRAPRGNPLTGPFYVEGAMPGDTLVVHLEKVRTNRDSAYQSNLIASSALEAGYLRDIAHLPGGFTQWKIDAAAGTASIVDPSGRMAAYSVPLSPMLGCIGVAPAQDEVMTAGHLGPFGGNMDYPEVREGATLYIPVFQPGALLFLGDGHAQQGAGELPGQGLETSMDVTFRVDLLRGKALGQPRLENADAMMVMGIGGTLDAAMKSATTQMSRWLADTYGLTPHDIAPFLGTAMEYQIAEVVDSEINVVAKVRKDALAKIRK